MPVNWNYYIKKKKIIPAEFVSKYNIKSYEDLISTLNLQDVIPPTKLEVSHLFIEKLKPASVIKNNTKSLATKNEVALASNSTAKKAEAKKSPQEVVVDENGFLVAPAAIKKKSTVRKSRRKRTTKIKS